MRLSGPRRRAAVFAGSGSAEDVAFGHVRGSFAPASYTDGYEESLPFLFACPRNGRLFMFSGRNGAVRRGRGSRGPRFVRLGV